MKKINYLMAMFVAAVLCVGLVSCKKSKNDDPEAKYLTVDEFAKSTWTGVDNNSNTITLKVESASVAKLTYVPQPAKKNTDGTPVTVTINYTFNASSASFTGTGDDGFSYSATLSSATAMKIKIPTGSFDLTRN